MPANLKREPISLRREPSAREEDSSERDEPYTNVAKNSVQDRKSALNIAERIEKL
jgi:hypothetical protein